ncbi:hypothetical protein EAW52_25030 [Pseudomonas sp. LTJR-52]|nr:hypothetical protein EAW52_25030 [Pseudomonas sp. LTJR-52]
MSFLSAYGVVGKGSGGYEVTFPPDEIADMANLVGSEHEGIFCIRVERPVYGDSFREFAFKAMQKFGLILFDDALEDIYIINTSSIADIPSQILEEIENGVTSVDSKNEIWQIPN